MKQLLITLVIVAYWLSFCSPAQARITPEDIINAKKELYQKKVISYSTDNQMKLQQMGERITATNKKLTDELSNIMIAQAIILDEYERRSPNKSLEKVKKVRYWITFAHEAVAYQAAKVYIFGLTSEDYIRSDVKSTLNLFQSEIHSTRSKVINSQKMLKELVGND